MKTNQFERVRLTRSNGLMFYRLGANPLYQSISLFKLR